jgi:hypothetical protein
MNKFLPTDDELGALQGIAIAMSINMATSPNVNASQRLLEHGYVAKGSFGRLIVTDDGMRLLRANPVVPGRGE